MYRFQIYYKSKKIVNESDCKNKNIILKVIISYHHNDFYGIESYAIIQCRGTLTYSLL
jgi:hypothetical protein